MHLSDKLESTARRYRGRYVWSILQRLWKFERIASINEVEKNKIYFEG